MKKYNIFTRSYDGVHKMKAKRLLYAICVTMDHL